LPYEVPQEILLERRNTNDDGTDFQRMKTAIIILLLDKKALGAFFYV
jgi:hypothetical protein